MVDLIYQGEAEIFQGQLESFLALAQELQLEGLKEYPEDTDPELTDNSPKEKDPLNEERKKEESSFSNATSPSL